ncbi:MAG: HPF/RaiA family ribosome-associated protein [Planctomycetaceae bacterium]|nr:HPF/RaiA family ribosome-associated protein [Planctomycetaceae bacterium]
MRVNIHASKVELSPTIEEYVERRLLFALGRFADVTRTVDVTLSDINGPKGGQDKLCRMRVKLNRQSKPVIADVLHEDLRTSIDLTADRLGRSVGRAVDRQSGLRIARRRTAAVSSRAGQLETTFG